MPKVGITHFDQNGGLQTTCIEVTAEELGVNCWLPARFLGGTSDQYYVCQYGEKANCKAGPSSIAREKATHAQIQREEIRPDCICAVCGELITPEGGPAPGEAVFRGDPGTAYEGESICDTCYHDDLSEPCATIHYGTGYELHLIGSCRKETEGDFRVEWRRTDPWRGCFECVSHEYVRVFDDAILSGHESEGMLKELYDIVLQRFSVEGYHRWNPAISGAYL